MICCFSVKTSLTSSPLSRWSFTMILAKTFSASPRVRPSAAWSKRFLGGRVAQFLRLNGGAGGNDARAVTPLEHFLLPFFGDLDDQILHAHLFTGYEIENGVAGADEDLEFGLKGHGE